MYISRNWLNKYIDIPESISDQDLSLKMTLHSVEVEGFVKEGDDLANIVVGKVLSEEAHPQADRLKVYQVDIGDKKQKIVCGGSNVKVNMLCAVALEGANLRLHGEGGVVELKNTEIRGVKSEGMICAANEIGLAELISHGDKEIIDLTGFDIKVGQPLAKALQLNDTIFEVDNKTITHRPDLWGHYGMARDIAAFLKLPLRPYKVSKYKQEGKEELTVSLEQNDKLCSRYMALVVEDIEVKESPFWLKKLLSSLGIRPVNSIVDISNYIMYELGQPMHIYDYDKVSGNEIVIRSAKPGEKIVTIDGKERILDQTMTVVADKKGPLLLGGIMGGLGSEVTDKTKTIIIEVANFDPTITRKTSIKQGLRTEGSLRYEKSLDPELCALVMPRTVELLKEISPQAKVISNTVDIYVKKFKVAPIEFSLDFLNRQAGIRFKRSEARENLERLGFKLEGGEDEFLVHVPSWRATKDISIQEDLVEEVCRVYGYDNFETILPQTPINPPITNKQRSLERLTKSIMAALGFSEVLNHSFVSQRQLDSWGYDFSEHLSLRNPVSEEHAILRRSLVPHLLQNYFDNHHNYSEIALCELGRVFKKEEKGPKSDKAGLNHLPGQTKDFAAIYFNKQNKQPFYQLKGSIEQLINKLCLSIEYIVPKKKSELPVWAHPTRICQLVNGEKVYGWLGEVHPYLLQELGSDDRIAVCEINFKKLFDDYTGQHGFVDIVKYPTVNFDLALVLDEQILWSDFKNDLLKWGQGLILDIKVFDVYRGDKIPKNKKSIAFHITYQAGNRTLTNEEVKEIQDNIILKAKEKYKATVRE